LGRVHSFGEPFAVWGKMFITINVSAKDYKIRDD
jgi:hypothetical protein